MDEQRLQEIEALLLGVIVQNEQEFCVGSERCSEERAALAELLAEVRRLREKLDGFTEMANARYLAEGAEPNPDFCKF